MALQMMRGVYGKLYSMLDPSERGQAFRILLLLFVTAMIETLGVASIMPFVAVLANPGAVPESSVLQGVYDYLGFNSIEGFLLFLGFLFLFLVFLSLGLGALSFWSQVRFCQFRNHAWSSRHIATYLRMPYDRFILHHSGVLGAGVLQETEKAVHGALFPAIQIIARGSVVVLLFGLMIVVDPWLALSVALVISGLYALMYVYVRGYLRRSGRWRREANEARFKLAQEAFGGIKEVKLGNLENRYIERFRAPSLDMSRWEIAARSISELPTFAVQALVFGGVLASLLYLLTVHGSLQEALPVFSLFILAGYRMMPSLQVIYRDLAHMRFHAAVLDRIHDDIKREIHDGKQEANADYPDMGRPLGLKKSLVLEGVAYYYPGTTSAALKVGRLTFNARDRIGIIGETGSGKSTLMDVVSGLLVPRKGDILVDGIRIDASNRSAWQRSIGYVPQHSFLADDTVAANIAFGVEPGGVDLEAVSRAAKLANIHDFVLRELPEGYQTVVGERGVRLSGGQRQRLAIARALYGDPEVIILDEGTSALDSMTEEAILEAIENISGLMTVIIVAHRPGTVRFCDKIVVMQDGTVADEGSLEEIRARSAVVRRSLEPSG